MQEVLKDFGIPLFTFLAGAFLEQFRQSRTERKNKIEEIRQQFSDLIDLSQQSPRNIARSKYDYNTLFGKLKSYCDKYGPNFDYLSEDLQKLHILTTKKEALINTEAEKLSDLSISIINKIESI